MLAGPLVAVSDLGVALIELGRHQEVLQILEQIIDMTENPAELWTSNNNIATLYVVGKECPV
jgi:hypothetical protein